MGEPTPSEWVQQALFGLDELSAAYHEGGADGHGLTVKEFREHRDLIRAQLLKALAATAAARAEVARRLDDKAGLPPATCYRTHTQPDEGRGVFGAVWIADVKRVLLEDAAPRQPEPDFCPHCGGQFSDMSGHIAHVHAAPDTTTGADR